MRQVPLSVLDLAPVVEGSTPARALANSLELARRTERLGYTRLWVAEHHNMPGIASSAPAVLIAHLAAGTERIRLGSGGVMLPNHAPLVIAEQFGTLESLHPGRIDLGLGRAPGTDPYTAHALRRDASGSDGDDFPAQLGELLGYFRGSVPHISATPGEGAEPAVWLLGSSGFSAQLAGLLGLPFAFAHHFMPRNTLPALALYREHFTPSQWLDKPYAMLCAGVICADTDEDAERLAAPGRLSILSLRHGRPRRLPTPAEAAAHPFTDADRALIASFAGGHVVGGPETVRAGLELLLDETGVDELMISTSTYELADRLRSYELVAELFAPLPTIGTPAAAD
jgi:luciferase family oxidoreductase group 1